MEYIFYKSYLLDNICKLDDTNLLKTHRDFLCTIEILNINLVEQYKRV